MRKSTAFLFPLILIVFGLFYPSPAKAQSTETIFKTTETSPFSFFDPCTNEVVSGNVTADITIHQVFDPDGGIHREFIFIFRGYATGETSGINYVGPEEFHRTRNSSSNNQPIEITVTDTFKFISQGSTDNILANLTAHITINANGEISTFFIVDRFSCNG